MTEEREHLQKLIELHRANLQHYEEQEAKCKIAEARKGRRGRREFRVIHVAPGFRVRGQYSGKEIQIRKNRRV